MQSSLTDIVKGKWNEFAGKAKQKWGKITDDHWLEVKGDSQRVVGLLQQEYGLTKEEAESEVAQFVKDNFH